MNAIRPKDGRIYAVAKDGTQCVKIGYTRRDIHRRFQALQYQYRVALSLLATVYVPEHVSRIERAIHKRLASSHIEGEWFSIEMSESTLRCLVQDAMTDVKERMDRERQESLLLPQRRLPRERLSHIYAYAVEYRIVT